MKKIFCLLLLALTTGCWTYGQSLLTLDERYASPKREVRAMWLTTLKGLDWPKKTANTLEETERQKNDLLIILDKLQIAGINTVLFQSRIRATTAYPSDIEPWDGIFTGTPGKAPLYDPLQFALDECHRRGMEMHAWVVAFPICPTDVARKLGKRALPYQRPELCQRCGDQWMMDPGVPGTDEYVARVCKEIVEKYDVDGIHLDYIRYPEKGIPFNDTRTYRKYGKGQNKSTWRSDNVTRTVKKIHEAVKSVRPWIKISCSPVGKYADLAQQSSYGWNARDAVHQHAQEWLRDGWMDMLTPMMYFDGKHFYPFVQDWQIHSYGRMIVPGLGIYLLHERQKNWDLDAIRRQMFFSRQIGTGGQVHFRSQFFTDNVKGLYDFAKDDFYACPVLPPAMTWEDSIAPSIPKATIAADGPQLFLQWEASTDNQPSTPVCYNIYYSPSDTFSLKTATPIAFRVQECHYTLCPALPSRRYGYYTVTAMDAYGNESEGLTVCANPKTVPSLKSVEDDFLEIPSVDHSEYILVTDLSGRHIFTTKHTERINIGRLSPGYYEIRTLSKKGQSHLLLRFWKEI